MNVEIAICTFNRSRLLRNTLSRLAEIDRSTCKTFRVIVVNNNCTDETDQVIAEFREPLNILPPTESRQGQVFARNLAIKSASGDLLIWIDDDVIVGDDWLASYVSAAREQKETSFWGGPIRPLFEESKPKWIVEHWDKLCGCFAERDLGEESFDFSVDVLPYGANFAIRTELQKQFPFDAQLGRTDSVVLGEDELTLLKKLIQNGFSGSWWPNACVDHVIDASRTTTDYIGSYFQGQGRALVIKNEAWSDDVDSLKREAEHELACFRRKRRLSKSEVWLSHLIRGSLARGQFDAIRH